MHGFVGVSASSPATLHDNNGAVKAHESQVCLRYGANRRDRDCLESVGMKSVDYWRAI